MGKIPALIAAACGALALLLAGCATSRGRLPADPGKMADELERRLHQSAPLYVEGRLLKVENGVETEAGGMKGYLDWPRRRAHYWMTTKGETVEHHLDDETAWEKTGERVHFPYIGGEVVRLIFHYDRKWGEAIGRRTRFATHEEFRAKLQPYVVIDLRAAGTHAETSFGLGFDHRGAYYSWVERLRNPDSSMEIGRTAIRTKSESLIQEIDPETGFLRLLEVTLDDGTLRRIRFDRIESHVDFPIFQLPSMEALHPRRQAFSQILSVWREVQKWILADGEWLLQRGREGSLRDFLSGFILDALRTSYPLLLEKVVEELVPEKVEWQGRDLETRVQELLIPALHERKGTIRKWIEESAGDMKREIQAAAGGESGEERPRLRKVLEQAPDLSRLMEQIDASVLNDSDLDRRILREVIDRRRK